MNKPKYSYKLVKDGGVHILVIVDEFDPANPSMTVTNGVEGVLKGIIKEIHALPPKIIYRDTEGEWCGLTALPCGEFLEFQFLGEVVTDEYVAIERIRDYTG